MDEMPQAWILNGLVEMLFLLLASYICIPKALMILFDRMHYKDWGHFMFFLRIYGQSLKANDLNCQNYSV